MIPNSLSMILIKENVPSPATLGQSNGIVQFTMCSARSVAPFLVRYLSDPCRHVSEMLTVLGPVPCLPYLSIRISSEDIYGSSSWLPFRTLVRSSPAKSRSTAREPSLDQSIITTSHVQSIAIHIPLCAPHHDPFLSNIPILITPVLSLSVGSIGNVHYPFLYRFVLGYKL